MRRLIIIAVLAVIALASLATPALADGPVGPPAATLWLDGIQVRTLAPPSAFPNEGRDPIYRVPGTGGVAAVGPGTGDYHGGAWMVYDVTWHVAQRPLTSAAAVLAAAASGDITITRNAAADFRCPIQP